ncbi:MAG: tyrosine-type recombinase/integrase, partial [Helicobacteraceae bacterium]|nr:tyrosine-type recombinase/integrase [Helicobacteraceae bacterium]
TNQIVGYSNDSIRTNPTIAYQKRTELVNKLKNGESIRANDNPTLDTYFNEYINAKEKARTLSKKKAYTYKHFYNKHIPMQVQQKKLKQLTKIDFQKIIDTLVSTEYKPSYIATVKTCFSPLFNHAISNGLLTVNFISSLQFPKYDANRYFSLSEDKAKALVIEIMNLADNQQRIMFMFLLRGRRAGEVLSLDWSNIDLDRKVYTIKDSQSKIRQTLTFTLDDEIIEHLQYLQPKKTGLLFINNRGVVPKEFSRSVWLKIKDNAGITDMKLHDFRHLLGFTLVNNNVPIELVSRALGHSKITTTQMYSNQKEQMAKEAVDIYLRIVKK